MVNTLTEGKPLSNLLMPHMDCMISSISKSLYIGTLHRFILIQFIIKIGDSWIVYLFQ